MKIVLASTNSGKLAEIQTLLAPLGHELILQSSLGIPEAEETGLTFVENAILKARHAAHHAQLPAIADDSGLCVAHLKGAPGIYSARYAGPFANSNDRNQKLLSALANVPIEKRQAEFYCAAVFMQSADDPTPLIGLGAWPGTILTAPQGEAGFGYDPIFYVPTHRCSAAELEPHLKNQISHRGLAFAELIKLFPEIKT
ncbi:MAG TPA: RdgB/HAM1 family non-canonical purine NTP pyrophosphatase [Coxiellaceae bacterium]|nr:RdgB/HAM1 family non-canonical purine NTP pyrophosphatase [Coxiellaceae bacterium]